MTINTLQPYLGTGGASLDADPYGPRGKRAPQGDQILPVFDAVQYPGGTVPTPMPKPTTTRPPTGGGTPPPTVTRGPTPMPKPTGSPGTTPPVNSPPLDATPPNPALIVPGAPGTGAPAGGGGYNGPTGPGTNQPIGSPTSPGGAAVPGYPAGMDAGRRVTSDELVANQLNSLLNSNSQYIRNARQRGVEHAASRGLANSSIAAGASQRAAIEAGMPIAQSDANAYRSANDQTYGALSQLRQMRVAGDIQNWLSDASFNREYNGQLAMMPIRSAFDMLTYATQRGLEDPAVYTPDVLSGFNNFFNQNMFNIMQNYFGSGAGPGGG